MTTFEMISTALAAVSVAALLWQIRVALLSMQADHERRKKQATIEFLMTQVRPLWSEGQALVSAKWGDGVLSDAALEEIQKDRCARELVKKLLGHLEYMSIGINTGIYDKDLLYRASGSFLIRLFHCLRPYIKLAQTTCSTVYIEFEHLVREFEERRKIKPPVDGNMIHS